MREVPLSQGMVALVDDADYEQVMAHTWSAHLEGTAYYAVTMVPHPDGGQTPSGRDRRKTLSMHRLLLGSKLAEIDHKDGNGLNNQRNNLREATRTQNARNRKSVTGSSSQCVGVSFVTRTQKWQAQIKVGSKNFYLGQYATEQEAAEARDRAAVKFHGQFAKLNKEIA